MSDYKSTREENLEAEVDMFKGQSEKTIWAMFTLVLLIFFAGVYGQFSARFHDYVPLGDEPALLEGSLNHGPLQWVVSGYSKYFEIYPEWFVPYTNFIRPITNAIVWISASFFGGNYLAYLSIYYISIFTCLFVALLIFKTMDLNPYLFGLFAVFWIFSPAVSGPGLWNIPFIFDVVATSMIVLAFTCVLKEKYISGIVLLTISVFTKETALFAPFAAALTILIARPLTFKRAGFAAAALLPIIFWIGLRLTAFGAIVGGTYASIGISSVARGLTTWPLGISWVGSLFKAWKEGGDFVLYAVFSLFYIILSLIIVISIAIIIYKICCSFRVGYKFYFYYPDSLFKIYFYSALIWFGLSLSYVVLLGVGGRFGSSIYFFLGIILAAAPKLYPKEVAGRLPVAALALLAVTFVPSAFASMAKDAASVRNDTALAKSLYLALGELPQNNEPVLVVNAPMAYSSPASIQWLTGTKNEISFLNQFEGCTHIDDQNAAGRSYTADDQIRVAIPECAKIVFLGAKIPPVSSGSDSVLRRTDFGDYQFVRSSMQQNITNSSETADFGKEFRFNSQKKFGHIIFYDWERSRYIASSKN